MWKITFNKGRVGKKEEFDLYFCQIMCFSHFAIKSKINVVEMLDYIHYVGYYLVHGVFGGFVDSTLYEKISMNLDIFSK